jgi:hypothetical protein
MIYLLSKLLYLEISKNCIGDYKAIDCISKQVRVGLNNGQNLSQFHREATDLNHFVEEPLPFTQCQINKTFASVGSSRF